MKDKIPERREIPIRDTWALEDLFASDEAWRKALSEFSDLCETIPGYRGKLGGSAAALYAYLRMQDTLSERCSDLANYAERKSDEDTRRSEYQAMVSQLETICTRAGELSDFEMPEITAIPDGTLEAFYEQEPGLRLYRRHLYCLRRMKKYTLSPAEEKLLASAGELAQLPSTVFERFGNADLRFGDAVDAEGTKHPVTQGTYIALLQDPDRVLRESAYHSYYAQYLQFRNTMAATMYGEVKSQWFYARARGFDSPLEMSLYHNEIPTEVYHNLIAAVRAGQPVMARYLKLRRRLLGLEELHFYDLYAPLVPGRDREIPFEEAVQSVREALKPLGEDYGRVLAEGFRNRWIDKYENTGKRSGAYSAGARVHPYVLLNYTPDPDGMFTIAHEMGHAMHSHYSNETQPTVYADYKIFVAEVASTCNEALLMEHLLGRAQSRQEKLKLINHFLEQFRATLYRQTMFAEFELKISEAEREGNPLTADTLQAMYRALLEDYFGDDVCYDEQITMEWARIPHFYYRFYVYQYATGYAAAIALSRRILREGEPAVSDYLRFLSGGCSKPPLELLRDAGVDMTQPKPVEDAIALFSSLVDEMEKLTEG